MKAENNVALKEWAVVCRALHEGRQVFLLRKGGIADKEEEFKLEENEFFIFPTYEHQSPGDLQDKFKSWIDDSQRLKPADGKLEIDTYTRVDSVIPIKDPESLQRILPHTIWSADFLKKRWEYKPERPLQLVFVRSYRYPHSHRIDIDPEYAGCVSWVTLKQPLSPTKFYPVLSAEVFEDRKKKVLEALENG